MKDIIIITAYTPDFEREGLLRNFVNSIDTTNFDLMVVSHSRLPDDLYDKVDYFIFDKENEVLTDLDSKYLMYWSNGDFALETSEARRFNHFIACYKLFFVGMNAARNLGYEKAHVIEYDTGLTNMDHFRFNSRLLDDHSVVYYKTDYTPALISFPMAFNLKTIREEWFEFDKEKIKSFPAKTIEDYELYLLNQEEKAFARDCKNLDNKERGMTINLYGSYGDNVWLCPLVDKNDNLVFFANNSFNTPLDVDILVNENKRVNVSLLPGHWRLFDLGVFEQITHLSIIKNKTEIINYDFNVIDKQLYKEKNYVK